MHRLTYRVSPKSRHLDRRPLDAIPVKIFEASVPIPKPQTPNPEDASDATSSKQDEMSTSSYRIGTERVVDSLMPEQ